jgi:hypothetical protein
MFIPDLCKNPPGPGYHSTLNALTIVGGNPRPAAETTSPPLPTVVHFPPSPFARELVPVAVLQSLSKRIAAWAVGRLNANMYARRNVRKKTFFTSENSFVYL